MSEPKKVFLKTYGCQMNVYDSERMATALAADGYAQTDTAEDADLILLNTCHIREKAAEKVYSELGRLKELKAGRPGLKIGVAGCVAQAEGAEIIARQPAVDLVVGPQSYHNLPKLLARSDEGPALDTDFPAEDKFDHLPRSEKRAPPSAFLTVQEGCDKFCTFCVVPYTRGAEMSRPVEAIVEEAERLVARGAREITLLGQNVNAYHGAGPDGRDWSLARLIGRLGELPDLARIRFTTSHPNDMSDDLIVAFGSEEKLMPYLHLPVQSGSDRILKAMNRKHTAESYAEVIARVREARPDIAISGDFIVGFPGETDADFEATLALTRAVNYAQAFSFKYSARPGTPAAERTEVPEDVKAYRLQILQSLLSEQQTAFQTAQVGKTFGVLLEKQGRNPGQLVGKSPYLQAVHLDGPEELLGNVVEAKVAASAPNSLSAQLVT